MTETDAKCWLFRFEQLADILDGIVDGFRVARAVRKEDTVRINF